MKYEGSEIKNILSEIREELSPLYEACELDQIIRILVRHYLGMNMADVKIRGGEVPSGDISGLFRNAKEELKKFRPVQYIIGVTSFLDAEIKLGPGVLIPRPETEELAEMVIRENAHKKFQEFSVLDIGTGSGCLAIALKKAFPYAQTDALDVSPEALNMAQINAGLNRTEVRFLHMDILGPELPATLPGYNLIVSNPPYITESEKDAMRPNVLEFEPARALFVPDSDPLLFYRTIGQFAWKHLVRPGTLWFEINERFGKEVKGLMESIGFDRVEVIRDLRKKDRFVRAEAKHDMADTSYWMTGKELP